MSNIINTILLKLILIIHIVIVIFILLIPFTNSNYLLLLHAIMVPFIMIHWVLNNNTCALTLFEKKIREKITGTTNAHRECFTCKIIEPIYDFKNNYKERATFIYAITTGLWLISVLKLYFKFKNCQIKNLKELMTI